MGELNGFTKLQALVSTTLDVFPQHASQLRKSLDGRSDAVLKISEQVSGLIEALAPHVDGGIRKLCSDYRFLCEHIVPPEELYFRRHNTYRLSSFDDAFREVYSNKDFMSRYMNGLIVSDVLWSNHAQAIEYYVNQYLPSLPSGADHLEIGPGHGLYLYFASASDRVKSISGWDVSPTSIDHTREALAAFGVTRPVTLTLTNLFETSEERMTSKYDSIVMSEILEHLEEPVAALKLARRYLKPGGRIWVNVPANSPAPDHLYLVDSPEHACSLVTEAGLEVEDSAAFPMTGMTMDKAIRRRGAISCLVTGREPA